MKVAINTFRILLVLVSLSIGTLSQTKMVPAYWHSSPSSPLQFEFPDGVDNADLIVLERAAGKIVGYDLGCVISQNGRTVKLSTLRSYELKYPVEQQTIPAKVLGVLSNQCKDSKLAITTVRFDDGSLWIIPEQGKERLH